MRIGDKQYGTLDLGTNNLTSIGDISESLSTGFAFWKLIQEVSLNADTATIEFNGIPQDFRHLIIMASARSTRVAVTDPLRLRFNLDTASNYDASRFEVTDGATLAGTGGDGPGVSYIECGEVTAANGPASSYSPLTIYILDYANTSRHKAAHSVNGYVQGTTAGDIRVNMTSGRWRSTSAITSVQLSSVNSASFVSGSMASLYGTDV